MAGFFREAHDTGQLQSADALGEHLLRMIERKFESGMLVKYDEA
ncbi:hypothetical protein [Paenibacillus harenae]|nr:hypothetical protein [Paenibacillus harenae]MDQ0060089.1 hypothetical protein [Paenibacillus harenae]